MFGMTVTCFFKALGLGILVVILGIIAFAMAVLTIIGIMLLLRKLYNKIPPGFARTLTLPSVVMKALRSACFICLISICALTFFMLAVDIGKDILKTIGSACIVK